jgi:hypothetical protein
VARYDLRLTDAEFWDCTLPELELLLGRHQEAFRVSHSPASMVCALLANINRDSSQKPDPFTPSDFMPGEESRPGEPAPDMAEKVARIAALFGAQLQSDGEDSNQGA